MKQLKFVLLALLLSTSVFAADPYKYTVDLTRVADDKVFVELETPKIKEKEIVFYMPKIIPGTYAIADYGRMVSDLKAYDKKGKLMEVERLDDNSWKISNAKKLRKITYMVEDTYDTDKPGPDIFQPAGTNIEEGKNFIINTSGFFGYFEGMKKEEFELNFIRSKEFYGATGLKAESNPPLIGKLSPEANHQDLAVDQFKVEDYDRLVDSPLMYSKADTAIIKVANTDVLIASYSPNKRITAAQIAESIREVLSAQNEFLGGKLPVDKYAFLFYFTDQPVTSYGALEHSYSSVYYMPEQTIEQMQQQLRDFAAHEFFHIVTPLNIHSEEIGSFDFNNPKMSRHLWLYEGMTEYFAGSVQVKYGLVTPEQYLQMLQEKIIISQQFKDELPFTELSLGALDEHADQYYNVYQKGALIGAALDIRLRELSDGAYGVQNMMADLSKKYGPSKSFKDEELFDEIVDLTYPEIRNFLTTYVSGTTPLPYKEIFAKVGVDVIDNGTTKQHSFAINQNNITLVQHKGEQRLAIGNEAANDALANALGLKKGDIILAMNGDKFPAYGPELNAFLGAQVQKIPGLETFTMTVWREVDGEGKEVKLSAKNQQVEVQIPLGLQFTENPSEEQLKLRDYWLKPAR
ncbi:peptidase M61 [Roseivirga sp. UBA1976]|uniref:M61 family metallopeptidase n=1 Tax=Roseivirga sp. UBA1976 TaxID=1947386 RepID=UPI00257DF098|nr:peptidase M61 [Roseivirga sp. UBA1976]|tara:strand:- start:1199 stop:3094 length:1896 start_codon:yes stop_codon:yes gene_type:complete